MRSPETPLTLPDAEEEASPEPRRRARSVGARARRRPSRTEAIVAVMEERMGNLEKQLDELKGRVNGLIFLIVGAAAAQFILRLLG